MYILESFEQIIWWFDLVNPQAPRFSNISAYTYKDAVVFTYHLDVDTDSWSENWGNEIEQLAQVGIALSVDGGKTYQELPFDYSIESDIGLGVSESVEGTLNHIWWPKPLYGKYKIKVFKFE